MPDRCEIVVQTQHGRTRCSNDGQVFTRVEQRHGMNVNVSLLLCVFHTGHNGPQCVGPASESDGRRCMNGATSPTENPQFCPSHVPGYTIRTMRNVAPPMADPVVVSFDEVVAADLQAMERSDQEYADVRSFWDVPLTTRPEVVMTSRGELEIRDRENDMPSVNFSQTAIPFVAALVERLGGEVTVPARQMGRDDSLQWDRSGRGMVFRLMRGGGVVRGAVPSVQIERVNVPAVPAPQVDRKIEVEKVFDEEERELRKLLLRCDECGLQFEKTHKTPAGRDECPYCTVRAMENGNKTAEMDALRNTATRATGELANANGKLLRLEAMLQEKINLVNEKSMEIRRLRDVIESRGPVPNNPPSGSTDGSLLRRIQQIRTANPGMGLREARDRATLEIGPASVRSQMPVASTVVPSEAPPRGGIRAAFDELAARFGGRVVAHELRVIQDSGTYHVGMETVRQINGPTEVHGITVEVRMQSQITRT